MPGDGKENAIDKQIKENFYGVDFGISKSNWSVDDADNLAKAYIGTRGDDAMKAWVKDKLGVGSIMHPSGMNSDQSRANEYSFAKTVLNNSSWSRFWKS